MREANRTIEFVRVLVIIEDAQLVRLLGRTYRRLESVMRGEDHMRGKEFVDRFFRHKSHPHPEHLESDPHPSPREQQEKTAKFQKCFHFDFWLV
jgi:hypothetical protein